MSLGLRPRGASTSIVPGAVGELDELLGAEAKRDDLDQADRLRDGAAADPQRAAAAAEQPPDRQRDRRSATRGIKAGRVVDARGARRPVQRPLPPDVGHPHVRRERLQDQLRGAQGGLVRLDRPLTERRSGAHCRAAVPREGDAMAETRLRDAWTAGIDRRRAGRLRDRAGRRHEQPRSDRARAGCRCASRRCPAIEPWARRPAIGGGIGPRLLWIPQIDDEVLVAFAQERSSARLRARRPVEHGRTVRRSTAAGDPDQARRSRPA